MAPGRTPLVATVVSPCCGPSFTGTTVTVESSFTTHTNVPRYAAVRYPGWPRPDRSRLTEQLLPYGAGGLLAFDLTGGPAAASEMIARLKLIAYVPSLGGPTTIVSYPPPAHACDLAEDGSTERRPYKSETVRLSIGLEDPDDIIADLRQALDAAMLA